MAPCYSLELCIQLGLSFPFSLSFPFPSLPSSAVCKASLDNHFAFLHYFFLGMVLIPASCTMSRNFVHSSSGTLSDIIPWVYLSLTLNNHKGFELGPYLNGLVVFPTFFKSEFGNKELMVWATVSSRSCFCWLYILWPSDAKSWLIRKDLDAVKDRRQEEKGTREDEMVGWHHRVNGHECEQALGNGEGQGSLACCSP